MSEQETSSAGIQIDQELLDVSNLCYDEFIKYQFSDNDRNCLDFKTSKRNEHKKVKVPEDVRQEMLDNLAELYDRMNLIPVKKF